MYWRKSTINAFGFGHFSSIFRQGRFGLGDLPGPEITFGQAFIRIGILRIERSIVRWKYSRALSYSLRFKYTVPELIQGHAIIGVEAEGDIEFPIAFSGSDSTY